MIRQTGHNEGKRDENESWKWFKSLTFDQFLVEVGMYQNNESNESPFDVAFQRYKNAISSYIKGNGKIFPKRNPSDVFTNNYFTPLMELHEANHDIQIVCDPYGCVQYVCDFLTKGE